MHVAGLQAGGDPCTFLRDVNWRLPKSFLHEAALLTEPAKEPVRWNLRRES